MLKKWLNWDIYSTQKTTKIISFYQIKSNERYEGGDEYSDT